MQRLFFLICNLFPLMLVAQLNGKETNSMNYGISNQAAGTNVLEQNVVLDTTLVKPLELEKIQVKPVQIQSDKKKEFTEERKKFSDSESVPATASEKENQIPVSDTQSSLSRVKMRFESNKSSASGQYNRRSATPQEQTEMDASAAFFNNTLPESFEAHFYTWVAGHYDTRLYPQLQQAAKLQPQNAEVHKQLAAYHIITGDADSAVAQINGMISDELIDAGQLAYTSDLLLSCDSNAVLVLHGFDDMFATYYVQQHNEIRKDVRIMSLDFMQSPQYRAMWSGKLNLPASNWIDTTYLTQLCRLNNTLPLQLSMTIPRDYFAGMRANLYPVGLTMRFSEEPLNNFGRNNRLWNESMSKQLVLQRFNDKGEMWLSNYLPMLITLRQQLLEQGKKDEAEKIKSTILLIGERTDKSEKIKKYVR